MRRRPPYGQPGQAQKILHSIHAMNRFAASPAPKRFSQAIAMPDTHKTGFERTCLGEGSTWLVLKQVSRLYPYPDQVVQPPAPYKQFFSITAQPGFQHVVNAPKEP
jgi:hypothetical protein